MSTRAGAGAFLVEVISPLFHAAVLITEQGERIGALEAEVERFRHSVGEASGMAA